MPRLETDMMKGWSLFTISESHEHSTKGGIGMLHFTKAEDSERDPVAAGNAAVRFIRESSRCQIQSRPKGSVLKGDLAP